MTINWTPQEWQAGRRLVQFTRNTDGKTTDAGHHHPHHHHHPTQSRPSKTSSSLVVSCIYWRERNDYYITSVDCIYLLEGLIGVQFTVEEKNRIRRNLEGFRPLTVSKCKPDCADFFKLIMGFPNPKPRNIEKDVKVFAWKTLPHALRKIIRKYTPSYSSTMGLGQQQRQQSMGTQQSYQQQQQQQQYQQQQQRQQQQQQQQYQQQQQQQQHLMSSSSSAATGPNVSSYLT
ncbi:hypothetical protein BDB00DRAFT_764954 [Zychaea mexicana]|uniref:uncharacterized protein n=1 Tax=Zychaea mexicana TaxID=64656 RepID=UPI0022FE1545|nr:uncharacterized protein BDB00DRAFT_764954 [Zychaea mexicana]KAI9492717.1 hypothetical protein BDB00DRAFT_764954 [Zychaea mexicana]